MRQHEPEISDRERHDLRLHRALQLARQVEYRGTLRFIGGIHLHKGVTEMIVYLTDSAEPIKPSELVIVEPPK